MPPSANPAAAARACGAQTAERRQRGTTADVAPRARFEEQDRKTRSGPGLHPSPGQEAFAQVYLGLSEAGYIGSGARQRRGFPQGPEPAHSPGRSGGGAGPPLSAGGSQAPGEGGAGGTAAAPGASGRSREGMLTRPLARFRARAAPGEAAAAGGGGSAGAACSAGRRGTSGLWQDGAGAHVALADTATSMARLGCEGFDQSQ